MLVVFGSLAVAATGGSIVGTQGQGLPRLVFSSDRGVDYNPEVYSLDLAGGARRDISRDQNSDLDVALHGRQVLFVSDRSGVALYVARLRSRAPARRLLDLSIGSLGGVRADWSPSGEEIAVGFDESFDKSVIVLVDGSGRRLARLGNARLGGGWSADGQRLAYNVAAPGRYVSVIRVSDSRGRLRFSRHGDGAYWASAAPRLAITATDVGNPDMASTVVYDEQGRVIRRFDGTVEALSPDGKSLVLLRSLDTSWLASVDTGQLRRLPVRGEPAAFSPDGKHLELSDGGRAIIIGLSSGGVEAHLAGPGLWLSDSLRLVMLERSEKAVTVVTRAGHVLRHLQLIPHDDKGALGGRVFSVTEDSTALVYTVHHAYVHQLYAELPSGGLRQITSGLKDHTEPAPSPNGRLIADSEFQTPCGICTPTTLGMLAVDGSGPVRLARVPGENQDHLTWSPDGTHIAYAIGEPAGGGITVVQADGSQPVMLTGATGATQPSWSPDGSAIAAVHAGIIVTASDGSNAQQLTGAVPASSRVDQTGYPTWSADSALLAFAGADGLYLIGRDGNGLHRIVAMPHTSYPAWSPDGTLIALAAGACQPTQYCNNDIWTVHPDGSNLRRITRNIADDTAPAWLPAS
jgi:Tol biopolymer transport system component